MLWWPGHRGRSSVGWVRVALACLFACLGTAFAAPVVWVIASDTGSAYKEATDALVQQLERGGLRGSDIALTNAKDFHSQETPPKLYIALGTEALRSVLAVEPRAPVLAALIPKSAYERVLRDADRKSVNSLSVLYLDQPVHRQVNLVMLALPEARRIGVLWGSESVQHQNQLQVLARSHGLQLNEALVTQSGGLFAGLRDVLESSDVLMMFPDSQVYNASTVANVFLTTYRSRVPVLAFSPGYAKAGGLLSLHASAEQIGRQAGSMARQLLGGSGNAVQYPAEFVVTVNDRVARSLGINLNEVDLSQRLQRLERRP